MTNHARTSRASVVLAAALLACIPDSHPAPLTLSIAPTAVELEPGATQQFTAAGTGASRGVQWRVAGSYGGDPYVGTITQDGVYRAPAISRAPVEVACVSSEDPGVSATATVTFPPFAITVSPTEADVFLGDTQQFTATVSGAVDRTVTWGGTDATGLYRAPAYADGYLPDREIRATSNASGAFATARVHLKLRPPVLQAVSGPAAAGDTVTITGAGLAQDPTVLFPSSGGEPIAVRPASVTDAQITAVVPPGATSGPLAVELHAYQFAPVRSNEVPFLRAARVRLHADRRDVAAGESVPLRVAWLGAPGPLPLAWSTDLGSVQAGAYVAPASVPESTFAHVSACVEGTTVCDGVVLGVHPFVVEPDPALVPGGGTLAVAAHASGAPVAATWSRLAGGGSVSAEGVYASSAAIEDAGLTWLGVSAGGVAGALPVGVRGAIPGLVSRTFEYTDHRVAVPEGAYAETMALAGSKLYVVASDPYVLYASREYHWIDVYDVSDPIRPSWIGAVESATRPEWMFAAQGRLYAFASSDWSAEFQSTLAVYDISGALPALIEHTQSPQGAFGRLSQDGVRAFGFDAPAAGSSAVGLRVYRLDGAVPLALERTTSLPIPAGASLEGATAFQDRAYVSYWPTGSSGFRVAAYDLAAEPPALLAEADGGGFNLTVAGPLLFADRGGATYLLDRRGDALALVATFPWGSALLDADATRAVLRTYQAGVRVVDIADPSAPRVSATLLSSIIGGPGRLVGGLLLTTEGLGGFAAYDVSAPGGLPLVDFLQDPELSSGRPNAGFFDLVARPPHLYVAGQTWWPGPGWVATYDLSVSPPALLSRATLPDAGLALAATDALLAVGTSVDLELYDRSVPSRPVLLSTLPLPTYYVALDGTLVFSAMAGPELAIVDVSAPAAPVEVARLPLGGTPFKIAVASPGLLVVAIASEDRTDGWLAVVDVARPDVPRVRATAPLGAPAWGLELDGTNAYVATAAGLAVVDLASPDAPALRSYVALQGIYPYGDTYEPAMACSVALHAGIVYVGTLYANGMVHGFDVRDPSWPRLVSLSAHADVIDAAVPAMAFHDRWAFMGSSVVDVSQPRNVVLPGTAPPALQR